MPGRQLMALPALGHRLSLKALAAAAELHPDLVERFVTYGLLEPAIDQERALWFEVKAVLRLRVIRRLQADLGINLPGVAVALDLLERIGALERELAKLRRGSREP